MWTPHGESLKSMDELMDFIYQRHLLLSNSKRKREMSVLPGIS